MLEDGTPVVTDLNYPLATVILLFVHFTHTMVLATSTRRTLVFQTRALVLDQVATATPVILSQHLLVGLLPRLVPPLTRITVLATSTKRTLEVLDHAMTEFYQTMATVILHFVHFTHTTVLATSTRRTLVIQTRALVLEWATTATLLLAPLTHMTVNAMSTKHMSEVLDHAMTEFYQKMAIVTLLPAYVTLLPAKTTPTMGPAISTERILAVLVHALG